MALIPIGNVGGTITIDTAALLTWPPPYFFGGYSGATVIQPVSFDFTSLRDLGRVASIHYFTYDLMVSGHDWAEVNEDWLQIDPPSGPTRIFKGAATIHNPPPDSSYYYLDLGYGGGSQPFDSDLKSGPFDKTNSPGFSYSRYFADSNHGGYSVPIPVLSRCGITANTFGIFFALRYWHFITSNLAYDTGDSAPIITISNLKAWCEIFETYNCTDPCGDAPVIASGHSATVCLQAGWVKDSELPNGGGGGLIAPPGQYAPISVTDFDGTACNCLVTIGCMSAETIAAHHYAGPYRWAFISTDHCTFSGIAYTRVYYADFSVSADVVCPEDENAIIGEPFSLQDKHGRYHVTGVGVLGIVYRRSDFGTNAVQGFAITSRIDAAPGKQFHYPRVIVDDRQSVRLAYAQKKISDGSWDGEYIADSNDDGATWEAGVLAITGGKYPTVAIGQDGTFDMVVLAAYVGPDSGPGVITAKTKAVGDAAFSDAFNFKDPDGADLVAAAGTFHIQQARDDQSRWMLHVKINGDSSTSQWSSYDETKTWERVP